MQIMQESQPINPKYRKIDKPLDLRIPEQRIMLSIYLTYAEVENLRRGLNVTMGQRRTIKEGRWPRRAPYGYKNARDERNKPVIVPDPEKASIVQEIFKRFSTDTISQQVLRESLIKKGHRLTRSNL
jgi:DNA invertase Pin-like site-specific DNA recombinase